MAKDARISTSLPAHPKTKKLIRRQGEGAAWRLICLFLWVAENRSDGDLSGMSAEDIELAADWQGEDGAFVAALVDVGFLDGEEGSYSVHNWAEHNPWAAGSEARSQKAKWNALIKHHGREKAAELMPEYYAQHATSMNGAGEQDGDSMCVAETSSAPSLTPSPSKNSFVDDKPSTPPCPHLEIVDLYNRILPELQAVIPDRWDGARAKHLQARWRESPKHQSLEFWERFFTTLRKYSWYLGDNERGWRANLGWIVEKRNFDNLIEKFVTDSRRSATA